MKAKNSDWYKNIWSLDIKNQSWVENTSNEVDFIIKTLGLTGNERILDLACGYGRHSLEFMRRGYDVVGADITPCYIEDAKKTAEAEKLTGTFILSDIRDICFENEFDVVLNLADGAVGYLENDEENLKIFDVVSRTLKSGGKHFMDICNGDYADRHFPMRNWDVGENSLALSEFDWDREKRIMLFGGYEIQAGEPLKLPEILNGDPTRVYNTAELNDIYGQCGMKISATFCNYDGKPASEDDYQLMVYAIKS